MKIGSFVIMMASLLAVLSFINGYWLGRLLRSSLRRNFRLGYAALTLLAAAAYLSVRWNRPFDEFSLTGVAYYFGPFWGVLQLLLLVAWPLSGIIAWFQARNEAPSRPTEPENPPVSPLNPTLTRRVFLSRAALIPPLAMTGINTVGVLDAETRVVLRRLDFAYAGLPSELTGLKIAHMTDVHVGPYVSARDVKKMADLLQAESPDLLAITGDFVDDVSQLPGVMAAMKPFLAALPLGAWFCMGNHEHLRGAAPIRRLLVENGIQILDNQNRTLPFGKGQFVIAGVDYPLGYSVSVRPQVARRYLDTACGTGRCTEFTVLLAHLPDFLPGAFEHGIHLTLAGHTHGGQVGWGQRSPFEVVYPYMRGVYGQQQSFGFVSSGAGHWMPFRLNCPPEVGLITLRRPA